MYNGWTNWETWVTVTYLEDMDNMSAGEIEAYVRDVVCKVGDSWGLVEDFLAEALHQVNFDEIAKAFEDQGEPDIDTDDFPVDDEWDDNDFPIE